MNHFYFGTEINGVDISGKTAAVAKALMTSKLQAYALILKEREDKTEQIRANEVDLKYSSEKELKRFKDGQNGFGWVFFTNRKMCVEYTFDEKLLKKRINKLSCLSDKTVEPKNPSFQYKDNEFVIVSGNPGNKVDKDVLYSRIADLIHKGKAEMDLESSGCYIKPRYDSKSKNVIEAKDTLNNYITTKVTYIFGDKKETLDASKIHQWLVVDKYFKVTVDMKKVKNYIKGLSNTYNTVGKARNFITSSGESIRIGGGDYGWAINEDKELQDLVSIIKEGKTIIKGPSYKQIALSHGASDIGNNYVEISIKKQHLWFYKNGSLVVQGDVVTGNVRNNHSTPTGIYSLKYKQTNAILKGPGYASHVNFWMPFNRGIGIHDASWRSAFGKNIYLSNGSHGCVNSPYKVAEKVFNNINLGTPVICY